MTVAPAEPPAGNTARFAAQPLSGGGTATQVWLGARRELPALDLAGCAELVVVAAHPDDETLGFGATSAMLAAMGVPVAVVSASDGGASHPRLSPLQRDRLEHLRRVELHRAASALGLGEPISLGLPDGQIAEHEDRLADLLTDILIGWAREHGARRRGAAMATPITKRSGGPPRSLCSAPARRCWSTRCGCGTGRLRRTRPCRGTEPTDRGFTPGPCAANAVPRSVFPASWSL